MAQLSKEAVLAGLSAASKIQSGKHPTTQEIDAAPKMSGWVLAPLGGGLHQLVGLVAGHPNIADGTCSTSAVLVMDPDKKWARTVSRLYALGPSLVDLLNEPADRTRS